MSIDALVASITRVAAKRCPLLEEKAQAVSNKFGQIFLLYSKCHMAFNSTKKFTDCDLAILRKLKIKILKKIITSSLSLNYRK